MSNWRLTAKQDIYSNAGKKDLRKGYCFIVASAYTDADGPHNDEVVGALLLQGFCKEDAEQYCGGSWRNYFDGWKCGEIDYNKLDAQHKAYLYSDKYSCRDNSTPKEQFKRQSSGSKSGCGCGCLGCLGSLVKGVVNIISFIIALIVLIFVIILILSYL